MSSFRLVAVVEGPTDLRWLQQLVWTWEARIDWADGGRAFAIRGLTDEQDYLDLHEVPARAGARRIPRLRSGRAGLARQALLLVRDAANRGLLADGAIVLVDTDGTVLDEVPPPEPGPAAMGFPHECIEAWVIACHDPAAPTRRAEQQRIGFDPFRRPSALSHKEHVPKSAKAVVKRHDLLFDDAAARRLLGWIEDPDTQVTGALRDTGLLSFVSSLGAMLSALIGHRPR